MNYEHFCQLTQERTKTFEQCCNDPMMLTSPTNNPYWETIKTLPGEEDLFDGRWQPKQWMFTPTGHITRRRDELVKNYSWAIPDPVSLQFVAEHSQGRIVEMACGTGYWLWQLSQLGIDCVGYDKYPPHLSANNEWHRPLDDNYMPTGENGICHFDIQSGMPENLEQHSDRTLFLCWPPYESSMATECLKHYHGKRVIYIGEGQGGCTADDIFHEMLSQEWEEVADHRPVQWEGIHDWITVYDRVGK